VTTPRRVVVTGAGVASPAGFTLDSFWSSLTNGTDIFSEHVDLPGSGILVGAIAPDVSFDDLPVRSVAACDRHALLAVSAAQSAMRHARLEGAFARPERVAVIVGNGGGGLTSLEQQYDRLFKQSKKVHPLAVVRIMVSSSASWISMAFGAQGPCFVTSSACASATQAIGTAMALIKTGIVDVAIAGGAEAPLSQGTTLAWDAMKVMSKTRCRPFSSGRDGLMMSEGAGMLILESEEHAHARGLIPRVELAGFASNADAADIVAPSADGMMRAMKGALDDAGLAPSDVSYINAHGTGTTANDTTETEAMMRLFGRDRVPPTSSIKGITGHSLGAAGALEAVATVLAMQKSIAPPTANHQGDDPLCAIDVIPNTARSMPIDVALSNSFAFGGLNASLAFRRIA
jgi:nodulation protein E